MSISQLLPLVPGFIGFIKLQTQDYTYQFEFRILRQLIPGNAPHVQELSPEWEYAVHVAPYDLESRYRQRLCGITLRIVLLLRQDVCVWIVGEKCQVRHETDLCAVRLLVAAAVLLPQFPQFDADLRLMTDMHIVLPNLLVGFDLPPLVP